MAQVKGTRIRRLVILGDVGIEAPGERKDVIMGRLNVFERFPLKPGREPKNTPYDIVLSDGGEIAITHPRSGVSVTVSKVHCFWYAFDAADVARAADEERAASAHQAVA